MSTGISQESAGGGVLCRKSIRDNQQALQGIQTANSNGNNVAIPGRYPNARASSPGLRLSVPRPGVPTGVTRDNVTLVGGGSFEDGQAYNISDKFGRSVKMTWRNGEFHLINDGPSRLNGATLDQKVTKDNVVLEGGGQFVDGERYLVKDRNGNSRLMIWQGGSMMPLTTCRTIGSNVSSQASTNIGIRGQNPMQGKPVNASLHQSAIRPELIKVMKCVFDLGYKKELVRSVAKHVSKGGTVVPDLNLFIDELEKVRKLQEKAAAGYQQGATGCSKDTSNASYAQTAGYHEEYQKLKDQRQCKICMEKDVEITFIPCGHFATCEQCGQPLKTCPICRQSVKSYVKTFMS